MPIRGQKPTLLTLLLALICRSSSLSSAPVSPLYRPVTALTEREVAVVINDNDPLSVATAEYYRQRRGFPIENLIHIRLPAGKALLSRREFDVIKQQVDAQTPKYVQGYVLTWLQPFRVECMSITTAFAAGFNPSFCAEGCKPTLSSPYYASDVDKPFDKLGWRPTMMLAASNLNDAKALIDRGVASDYTKPQGSAYLLKTSDKARSSRAVVFPDIARALQPFWPVKYLEQDYIAGHQDVMFYFTGLTRVPHLHENRFLPGAIADHLTSTGGVLSGSSQMSILEWIDAGATGSYGTVIEPCNFPAKFPNPAIVFYNYLRGSSLIEAYWKSVSQPGQGIFIGEPLAKPFAFPAKPRN